VPDRTEGEKRNVGSRELAIFAHEVRGALTVISGFAEVMRRPLPEHDRIRALDGIAHAANRIDRLVQSALEGRLSDGRPEDRVDLAALVDEVATEQSAVTERRIEAHVLARPIVLGAADALERALGNLIGNALKYSLRDSVVEVSVSECDGRALLSVADRGPGIPEGERERVLEPFERLESHRDVEGSGLGLTVVRDIAELHGGAVRIEDRAGGGAVVTIELPIAI
jgi:signal transduction histidine kinase